MSEQPGNVTNLNDYRGQKDGTPLDDTYFETGIHLHQNNSVADYSPETKALIERGREAFEKVERPRPAELTPVGLRSLKLTLLNNVRQQEKEAA